MEYNSEFYEREIRCFIRDQIQDCDTKRREAAKLKSILQHCEFLFRECKDQIKKENKK